MEKKLNTLKKYSFWNQETVELGYFRKEYTEKIFNYAKTNRLIKVLTGQRRVGKSYILRQIIAKLINEGIASNNIIYINTEFLDFSFLKTAEDLSDLINLHKDHFKPEGRVFIFIDEIQNIEGWEKAINSLSQDFTDEYELFISGSNSKMLSGELSTLLSGRYICFEIFPYGFKEYIDVQNLKTDRESYIKYMSDSGMPELTHLQGEELKRNYIDSIKNTVILKDIIQRYSIKDPHLLEDLFIYIVNNASNLLSISKITNFFKSKGRKTTYDTIANYLGYLEDCFLIHKSERYNIRGKETISGNCKYYLNDLCFHNYLYRGFAYGSGYMLENLVYLDLKRKGYNVYTGENQGKEIDFIAMKADKVMYIQVTQSLENADTAKREYSAFRGIKDNYKKIIVSLDSIQLPSNNGIDHIQAWNL